jgi:chromate reductase
VADTALAASPPRLGILAISGSLRRASINSAVLRAAAQAAARDGVRVAIADSVGSLPPFDPDHDREPPASVRRFRKACEDAAGVLLAVPEYTFGIPGAFKNALDWTVGSGSLSLKPIAVLKVSPPGRGVSVGEALNLALRAHGADVVHRSVPVSRHDLDAHGEVDNARIITELRTVVAELAERARLADAA